MVLNGNRMKSNLKEVIQCADNLIKFLTVLLVVFFAFSGVASAAEVVLYSSNPSELLDLVSQGFRGEDRHQGLRRPPGHRRGDETDRRREGQAPLRRLLERRRGRPGEREGEFPDLQVSRGEGPSGGLRGEGRPLDREQRPCDDHHGQQVPRQGQRDAEDLEGPLRSEVEGQDRHGEP